METLGDKINQIRRVNGMSQEKLSDKLGVSRQTISKWESNIVQPSADNIKMLSNIFCVSTDYFLDDNIEESREYINSLAVANSNSNRKNIVLFILLALNIVFLSFAIILTIVFGFTVFTTNSGDYHVSTTDIGTWVFYVVLIVSLMLFVSLIILIHIIKRKKDKCK